MVHLSCWRAAATLAKPCLILVRPVRHGRQIALTRHPSTPPRRYPTSAGQWRPSQLRRDDSRAHRSSDKSTRRAWASSGAS